MPSQGITNVANAIINKINNLISSHNNNENAHQDIRESIPSASSATPSADTTNGSVGTGTAWARSDHTHPKSSLYAEASHTHSQYLTSHQDITGKEDKSNKVTSLSSSNTDTEYPSAKTVYDELMNVRTVTPPINDGGSQTVNNVTKNWHYSRINSSDLEYFEKIVYNITFEDNDFQMFYQQGSNDQIIYFDGTDCYQGEWNENGINKGSLICEGNTIQATVNKDKTVTIGNTTVNWYIYNQIIMFGDVDFTYTIYSHKYLDTDFPYTFEYGYSFLQLLMERRVNSVIKDYGRVYLSNDWDNSIEEIYTITFNDDDFSYLDCESKIIYFDGTDCYWGRWEGPEVLNKGTLICEGNVVQATYIYGNDNRIYFPDGNSISHMDSLQYFGDVNINVRSKALRLEYVSNKVSNWNSTPNNFRYPTEKLVKDSLDGKANSTHTHTVYVEKSDMTNNSLNIDSLLASVIDYGMDNDSEW